MVAWRGRPQRIVILHSVHWPVRHAGATVLKLARQANRSFSSCHSVKPERHFL